MEKRRNYLMGLLCSALGACSSRLGLGMGSAPSGHADAPDTALKYKFRRIYGGEKMVTALIRTKSDVYTSFVSKRTNQETWGVFAHCTSEKGWSISTYGGSGLAVPKVGRFVRFAEDAKYIGNGIYPDWKGTVLVDSIQPIAERIPDELLDDLRRDPKGSLRIKIMFHSEGFLLGWDIERRPGFDPNKRDIFGQIAYVAPVHSFAGGDFCEAKTINGQAVRKGWYIHPKTGQRIETDF